MTIEKVQKRNGEFKPFDLEKIVKAIFGAMGDVKRGTQQDAENIAKIVENEILTKFENKLIIFYCLLTFSIQTKLYDYES